jgi:hypothetical protein
MLLTVTVATETGPIPAARPKSYDEQLIEAGQCPELVWYDTEDGRVDGRCLAPITEGGFACPGHTAQIEEWRGQTEAEKLAWERTVEPW